MMPIMSGAKQPFRRLIFMPWQWSRWVWVALLATAPVIYFLSAIPVILMVEEYAPSSVIAFGAVEIFYYPVWLIADVPAVGAVLVWEEELMEEFLDWQRGMMGD